MLGGSVDCEEITESLQGKVKWMVKGTQTITWKNATLITMVNNGVFLQTMRDWKMLVFRGTGVLVHESLKVNREMKKVINNVEVYCFIWVEE